MADLTAYHRAIAAARAQGLALTRVQANAFRRLLESYAEELASRVALGIARQGELETLRVARGIIEALTKDLALSTRHGVVVTSERVAEIYSRATFEVLLGSRPDLTVDFLGLPARAAQATLARPELARTFVSIRRESSAFVTAIIRRALVRGATPDQLAMELRLHILGAESLPAAVLRDRRTIGYRVVEALGYARETSNLALVRKLAGRVANRAHLIARTEIMAAEHETHVQGAIDSPIVRAIRWRLSSRHSHRDVCDVLAEQDIYGLGPGLYDPRRTPPRPHPRDICIQEDVLFEDPEQYGLGRGDIPERQADVAALIEQYELPPSQEAMLSRALEVGETRTTTRRAA